MRVRSFSPNNLAAVSLAILGVGLATLAGAGSPAAPEAKVTFTEDGKLVKPEGYREWVHVGTPITPNDMNLPEAPFPDFHNVYIHPDDYAHYKKTGEFADGTLLIKELVSVGSKTASSGTGYFMGEFIGLEAAIKDSVRFKDEPGFWAYFTFGHSYPLAETAPPAPVSTCNACHASNAEQDYVFTQFYPVLRAVRPN
jgi:hypothetical protein